MAVQKGYKFSQKDGGKKFELRSGAAKGEYLSTFTITIGDEDFEIDNRTLDPKKGLIGDYETRDFTINALYLHHDINKANWIIDYKGKGLKDL